MGKAPPNTERQRYPRTLSIMLPCQQSFSILRICAVLSLLTLNSGIDATVITTSLPTITREIGGASEYVWAAQSYLFASTIPQLLYGQIVNIFGRRRPPFVAMALFAIGSGIGGALAEVNWRWVFWLNLPVSGASALVIFLLLRVQSQRHQTWRAAIARVDFLGNAIFMPSMTSLFLGLIMAARLATNGSFPRATGWDLNFFPPARP